MSNSQPNPLMKQHSLPPDVNRDEAWLRKKKLCPSSRPRRSKSCISNDDIEELKGCLDLGFGFKPDSPDFNPRLYKTIPCLDLYCTVNRQYNNDLCRTSSSTSSEGDFSNSNTTTIVNKGDDGKKMKKKLKQWAKVVACSVRHSSGQPN